MNEGQERQRLPGRSRGVSAATWELVRLCCDLLSTHLEASGWPLRILELAGPSSYRSAMPETTTYTRSTKGEVECLKGPFDLIVATTDLVPDDVSALLFHHLVGLLDPSGFLVSVAPAIRGDGHDISSTVYRDWARSANAQLVWTMKDARGPGHRVSAIFALNNVALPKRPLRPRSIPPSAPRGTPAAETWKGAGTYLDVLAEVHQQLMPDLYVEIGVHRGLSLRLAKCRSVAIDPDPRVRTALENVTLFSETSDDFFRFDAKTALDGVVDLAFIDGMHLFEYALRDFMNLERYCHQASLVIIDDVLPNHPIQARRHRASMAWCGDVWKLVDCLVNYRPDLQLMLVDAAPTGLLLVHGLNPSNTILWEAYDEIIARYVANDQLEPTPSVLDRVGAFAPGGPEIRGLADQLRQQRRLAT